MTRRLPMICCEFLSLWVLLILPGHCDPPTITLRTELEDLQEMKSRLLIDYAQSRLLVVENRSAADSLLQPQRWALGISSPVAAAGPVCLEGVLAELYNPLAHGPGSTVFSEAAGLSLDIDLEVGSRYGLQLALVPKHWNLFVVYKEQIGVQLGSGVAIAFGRRLGCELVGLLSDPADLLQSEAGEGWYFEAAHFPGGLLSHLAGSLDFDLSPLRLKLIAAASGGQLAAPGAFASFHMVWAGPQTELTLLAGHCTDRFFTPEGAGGDLQWIAAVRVQRDNGPLRLSGSYRKEIPRLSLLPASFCESRDRFTAGAELLRRFGPRCLLSIESHGEMELRWSTGGVAEKEFCLDAGGTLKRNLWKLAAGMGETWGSESGRLKELRLSLALNPGRGDVGLEMELCSDPVPGLLLAAEAELNGKDKRFYARVETKQLLPVSCPGKGWEGKELLELFSVRLGWEAESRCMRRSTFTAAGPRLD